jgi:hypothetical protein
VLDIIKKVTGAGQPAMCIFFSGFSIRGSHVFIVPVFLKLPAFQALYYIYIHISVIRGIASLLATSC